ncbi:3' terminal RNA ribose 2'-O-methyltransferase Hen1, partial [Eubacteriales bacterium OttesenSCG-928-N14]|nr:3' terminal RNA ribose 2'-O-methyltransferase Hen1 [Eubacteriales bacterium OttesenSCG-928-N14]
MLLSITYRGRNASDLGYLLFKNPSRPREFSLNYGKAYVFYPVVEENICTASLLLDIDPIDLARGKVGSKDGGLFDYVNDRPYVSSSFMSTAISRVYGTALSGRCDKRPELVEQPLDLEASVIMLPCRGDTQMLNRVFEPLGYQVEYRTTVLDEKHPEWGEGNYVDLTIRGTVRLQSLLRHLYVLIPVFDRRKHYWIGRDEVDKLLRNGEDWLDTHPEKEFITHRYVAGRRRLAQLALKELSIAQMDDGQAGAVAQPVSDEVEDAAVSAPNLNTRRLQSVVQVLKEHGVSSVIDMGCGEGKLLSLLLKEKQFSKIAGMDVSVQVLEYAKRNLKIEQLPEIQKNKIALFQGSITYADDRFKGFDAACVIEVIEHLDESRLAAFERVLFGEAKPGLVLLTTPNAEYNENYAFLKESGQLRHGDHRFEWTREQFQTWA